MPYEEKDFRHILTIGTHRFLENALESYLDEIAYMEKILGEKVPFVIIDESDADTEQRNRELIRKTQAQHPDAFLIHFDSLAQNHFFSYFLDSDVQKEVVDLLHFKGTSYGRILNKQFLLAAAFGADYVHRRDSDTRTVAEANSFLPAINTDYRGNKVIYLVGSGYSGGSDWKIDYSMLLPDDRHLIYKMNEMLGYPQELNEKYFIEITTKTNIVQEKAKYLPRENHSSPDCGNISFYKIHRHLPCSPIPNTIGSDYFSTFLLKYLDFPIIYHNHFVYHEFTGERKRDNLAYAYDYWPRVVNYMDYFLSFGQLVSAKLTRMKRGANAIDDMKLHTLLDDLNADETEIASRRNNIIKFSDLLLLAHYRHSQALFRRTIWKWIRALRHP